ncbi:MAG: hypothetical protein HQL53_05395 [Magnetococcales bacterium]|nr:hypothetical protein [Magnetococcales bacterium]
MGEEPRRIIDPMSKVGIGVGIFLICFWLLSLFIKLGGGINAQLLLCTGLSILLGIFGGNVVIKLNNVLVSGSGIVISGVAGITFAFLYFSVIQQHVVFGFISGDDINSAQVVNIDCEGYLLLGSQRSNGYAFAANRAELTGTSCEIGLTFPEGSRPPEKLEETVNKIDVVSIKKHFGSGHKISWRLDKNSDAVETDQERYNLIDQRTSQPVERVASLTMTEQKIRYVAGDWSLIKAAKAAEAPNEQSSRHNVEALMADLTSVITHRRRSARNNLATMGTQSVEPLLKELRKNKPHYQLRLGSYVALAKMLRYDKNRAAAVANILSETDIAMMVRSLDDSSRTIRIYVGEFLFDLGDPRVVKPAMQLITRNEVGQQGRYNALHVMTNALFRVPQSERRAFQEELRNVHASLGPSFVKTKALINKLLTM